MKAVPENPRGNRSMSYEMRCKGKGSGTDTWLWPLMEQLKLSINGKFVNGIREADLRKVICVLSRRVLKFISGKFK